MKAQVIITISGGVADLVSKTPGVEVIIRDYDVEGSDEAVTEAANGDRYVESKWAANEEV